MEPFRSIGNRRRTLQALHQRHGGDRRLRLEAVDEIQESVSRYHRVWRRIMKDGQVAWHAAFRPFGSPFSPGIKLLASISSLHILRSTLQPHIDEWRGHIRNVWKCRTVGDYHRDLVGPQTCDKLRTRRLSCRASTTWRIVRPRCVEIVDFDVIINPDSPVQPGRTPLRDVLKARTGSAW